MKNIKSYLEFNKLNEQVPNEPVKMIAVKSDKFPPRYQIDATTYVEHTEDDPILNYPGLINPYLKWKDYK